MALRESMDGLFEVLEGARLWHALGAKTIELFHENVHLETIRDDIETLVLDAEVLEGLLDAKDPENRSREIEIKLVAKLRKHAGNPHSSYSLASAWKSLRRGMSKACSIAWIS